MDNLIDLKHALTDAEEAIDRCARLAYELSGDRGGRAPSEWTERHSCNKCNGKGSQRVDSRGGTITSFVECLACEGRGYYETRKSDPGEPSSPGDPMLVTLSDRMERLVAAFRSAVGDEVREAIAEAEREALEDDREVIREPR